MSLLKQLLLSVSVAILGILLGTLALSIDSARSYLTTQLQSQSENAVTSLALVLSQPSNRDPITQELLIAGLFDTGQFIAVSLNSPEGEVLVERRKPVRHADQGYAPAWFARLLPLPQFRAARDVSDGWHQVGKLVIEVDNQFAMEALWSSSKKLSGWIVGAGLLWALFVGLLMQWLRRILREEIEAQVLHIGTDQSQDETGRPVSSVAEFEDVSQAIQHTRTRVQKAAKAQSERIEILELETNSDPVTHLPNRKYFVNELNKELQQSAQTQGQILMVRQRDLKALNGSYPREAVDTWLRDVWEQVRLLLAENAQVRAQLARLNGSDFVVLLPGDLGPQGMQAVQSVRTLLQSLKIELNNRQWSRWAFALTGYTGEDTVGQILTRLDTSLMQAESAGHGDVEYAEHVNRSDEVAAIGEGHWQTVLKRALVQPQRLQIGVQACMCSSEQGVQVRHEASLELHENDGKVLGGSLFLPAVVRLGLSAAYDLQAVALGLAWMAEHPREDLVIRISVPSLEHDGFIEQLHTLLRSPQAQLSNLILELDAHALEVAAPRVTALCDLAASVQASVGLRRLDQSPKVLLMLSSLPLNYVKLGDYFVEKLLTNSGVRYLLEAMIQTAKAQKTRVYIAGQVDPDVAVWLRDQGVDLPVDHG